MSVDKFRSRDLAAPTPTEAAAIDATGLLQPAAQPQPETASLAAAILDALAELRDFEADPEYLDTATHQRTRVEVARDSLERAVRAGWRP